VKAIPPKQDGRELSIGLTIRATYSHPGVFWEELTEIVQLTLQGLLYPDEVNVVKTNKTSN
jgi:hypothetical protein